MGVARPAIRRHRLGPRQVYLFHWQKFSENAAILENVQIYHSNEPFPSP